MNSEQKKQSLPLQVTLQGGSTCVVQERDRFEQVSNNAIPQSYLRPLNSKYSEHQLGEAPSFKSNNIDGNTVTMTNIHQDGQAQMLDQTQASSLHEKRQNSKKMSRLLRQHSGTKQNFKSSDQNDGSTTLNDIDRNKTQQVIYSQSDFQSNQAHLPTGTADSKRRTTTNNMYHSQAKAHILIDQSSHAQGIYNSPTKTVKPQSSKQIQALEQSGQKKTLSFEQYVEMQGQQ